MKQKNPYEIVSFYHFTHFKKSLLKTMQNELTKIGKEQQIVGLILISKEGINATVSGEPQNVNNYLHTIEKITNINEFFYKKSPTPYPAFKRLKIKIKKEIITLKKTNISASFGFHQLEPDEWEAMLNEKHVQVLDIRNDYEIDLGQFKKANHLDLKEFNEFPEKLPSAPLAKKQKTLIYCTAGIRCEKAISEMKKQGFKEVYQLRGGIINYLKEFPHKSFEGECFVFDKRVAVDQDLNPSKKYSTCPHCGQAAGKNIICNHCGSSSRVCQICINKNINHLITCSKNCAHHSRLGHKYKNKSLKSHAPSFK